MDILTQWVTTIIVFVLLATVIDLLVPATVMKKYIKLVIGLILILIFLKPIFLLFDVDIKQALETSFSQVVEEQTDPEKVESLTEMQKKEIQAPQDAYILEELAVQLKDLAKDPLLEGYQKEITDIDFQFAAEKEHTYENLTEVIVYLGETENGEGAVSIVEDVDEVVINTNDPVTNEELEDLEGIKQLLQDVWEIENQQVTIYWEGGAP